MKAPMKILWLSAVLSLAFIACKDEAKPQTKEAPADQPSPRPAFLWFKYWFV